MENTESITKNQNEYVKNLEETCKSQEAQIKLLENKIAWMMEQIMLSKHKKMELQVRKVSIISFLYLMKLLSQ